MRGAEYAGYLDIKLPSKSRAKRTKAWVQRWIVLHKISDLSAGKLLAKLDIYLNSDQACLPDTKLSTILLDNVTGIVQATKSKSHLHAFEIQNKDVSILFFSATSPCETYIWVCLLREIFCFQPMDDEINAFEVWIRENEYSVSLGLSGDYLMRITPSSLFLKKQKGESNYEWPLSTLKRFYVRPLSPEHRNNNILIIESGLVTNIGEAKLIFVSPRAENILATIRTNIYIAMKKKDNDSSPSPTVRDTIEWERISNMELPFTPNSQSPQSLMRGVSYDPSASVTLRRKTDDFSILDNAPPPKPARSYLYNPSSASSIISETISCPDKVAISYDMNPESFDRQSIFRHSDSELKPYLSANVGQHIIDESVNTQQVKTPTEMKGSICSRDSGIMCASEMHGQDSEANREYRRQTFRSNSTDSAVSLQYERQRSQTQNKMALNSPIPERNFKLPLPVDSVDIQSNNSNIYWDIDSSNVSEKMVPELIEKKQFLSSKAMSELDLSIRKIKEDDENDTLSQKSNHEYEEVSILRETWTEEKIHPPALPKRPKSLLLNMDKPPQKSSGTFIEKIQESFLQISPKIKRKLNDKQQSRTKNLNDIINDFRIFSAKNKTENLEDKALIREYKKEFNRRDSDVVTEFLREKSISEWRSNRIVHSFSVSDASQLHWNEEETKDGVFVVEQKIAEKEFLGRDPFGLLPPHKLRQPPEHAFMSDIGDKVKSRCYSECHDTESNSISSDNDSDEQTFRRRTMSLESKIGHQIIQNKVKNLKKDSFLRKALSNSNKDTLLSRSSDYIDMTHSSLMQNTIDKEAGNSSSSSSSSF